MGFFTNSGALKEGEIVLSGDRRQLYQIIKGKFIEFKKILTPPGNPKLWVPGQQLGASIFDSTKQEVYVYNIEKGVWDEMKYGSYDTSYISDLNAYNAVLKLYEAADKLPKNMHI